MLSRILEYAFYGCAFPALFFWGYWKRYRENSEVDPQNAYELFVVCLVSSALPSLYQPLVFGTIAVLEMKLVSSYGSVKSAPVGWYLLYMGLLWTIPVGGFMLMAMPKFVSYETVAGLPIIGKIVQKYHPTNRAIRNADQGRPRKS